MRLSLGRLFLGAALASVLISAGALGIFLHSSRHAALASAEHSRQREAERVEARVALALGAAQDALENVQLALASGAVEPSDRRALEALLYTQLLGARHVAEVTFSEAALLPSQGEEPVFAEQGRFQLSLFRTPEGRIATRRTERQGHEFAAREWLRDAGSSRFASSAPVRTWSAPDPTLHPTFSASVAEGPEGRALWSDLHHSELDAGSAAARVVLTVQQAVWDAGRQLLGVVRVGLLTTDLDAITEGGKEPSGADGVPSRIVLLAAGADDAPARLVARVSPADTVVRFGDDLRIVPLDPPAEVAALLASPLLRELTPECAGREGKLHIQGRDWLATLSPLSIARGGTAGWLVAVLVPEAAYTRELVDLGRVLALVFGATLVTVLAVGAAVLVTVQRGLRQVGETTARMRNFDFGASSGQSPLSDIHDLLASLETAKTVTRALCKYIPVPLVRRLYERKQDPELGGELREVSLLFTDIQGFTALSEQLSAGELAQRLGRYFEVLTRALEAHGATIDKYIGDAVMAFWNAPVAVADHPAAACRAVLAARAALAELYASSEWHGLPPLVTRFGLHRSQVLVGHFGAPSRLSYTALGDGVNLGSRLESLCKQYGLTVLVSGSLHDAAGDEFAFRHVDRVIVQGKRQAVDVYELLDAAPSAACRARVQTYEAALVAYFQRDFAGARTGFATLATEDAAARLLEQRCQRFEREPPAPNWNGAHSAEHK